MGARRDLRTEHDSGFPSSINTGNGYQEGGTATTSTSDINLGAADIELEWVSLHSSQYSLISYLSAAECRCGVQSDMLAANEIGSYTLRSISSICISRR